jgi:hypothetical protein
MYVVEKQGIVLLEKNIISSCVVASFHLRPINPEDIKILTLVPKKEKFYPLVGRNLFSTDLSYNSLKMGFHCFSLYPRLV